MSQRDDYFSRVRPLLGDGLSGRTIGVRHLEVTGRVVELLAGCMLGGLVPRDPGEVVGEPLRQLCSPISPRENWTAGELIQAYLAWKNPHASPGFHLDGEADVEIDAAPAAPGQGAALVWAPGRRLLLRHLPGDLFGTHDLCNAAARKIRDALLGRAAWPVGVEYHGSRQWPFSVSRRSPVASSAGVPGSRALSAVSRETTGRHVMVVGCGSVGSEVVRLLAHEGLRWTLVDPGEVSIFNPHRQWFGSGDVGQPKVQVLRRQLGSNGVRAVARSFDADHGDGFDRLVKEVRPDLVLLATGTRDHGPLARVLWRAGVPHLASCAYPQARYFEISVMDPHRGTPCLHCLRGHLYRGAEPAPPMTDEVASFLYRHVDDRERERLYVDLVAEPATPIETGRIAEVTARTLVELLAPPARRSPWFTRMLDQGTTCLLGGNVVEEVGEGETAYGLTYPGQVVRLGLEDLVGHTGQRTCEVCGRRLETSLREEMPSAGDDLIDNALLGVG